MVNRSCRGFYEWIAQRVSAVLIGGYAVFLLFFLLTHQPLQYPVWHELFSHVLMRMATVVVVVAVLWHAWIGLWTVFTDYVKHKPTRLLLEIIMIILLLSYLVWGLDALWG